MTALQRTALGIVAALLIALALLLPAALAKAQEPPEGGARLEPGVNLVGWVGEATPVSQLFDEIPQLESIWAWDAELDDWIVAGRGTPEWLGGLGRVWAGMGLRLMLGGEEPFVWQRSTEPTRGLVKLRTGWNLVAWSGADQTPIDNAVKGIGWSLRTVRRWDAGNQEWTAWTSPERTAQLIANADQEADDDSAMPAIQRGEALWINVARAVNWLQPTDILPRLIFPGGASQQLQTRVQEDLESVLAFYRDQYGIQADPDFSVYIPKDADALIQAWKDDGEEVDDDRAADIRASWGSRAGWITGGGLVVKQELWSGDLASSDTQYGTYVLAHEYTHVIQGGLRGPRGNWSSAWLSEGGAEWAAAEFDDLNGVQSLDDRRESLLPGIRSDLPTLRSAEVFHGGPVYRLGEFAIDRLVGEYGADSWIEVWRRLAPTEAGPHRRWESFPGWQTALSEVTGIAVSEFYDNFNAWQREQALKNAALGPAYHGRWIRGRVIDSNRRPVGGAFVEAIPVDGEPNRTEAAVDGRFEVIAPESGDYRLLVTAGDRCAGYYSSGGLVTKEEDAALIRVSDSDVPDIDIRWSSNMCEQIVRGQVVSAVGEPLAGVSVGACLIASGVDHCSWLTSTTLDGSFAVSAPSAGAYYLGVRPIDDCTVYYRSSGEPTLNRDQATLIRIEDNDVSGFWLQVPSDLCRLRVVGNIEGIERFLDNHDSVEVHLHPRGPGSKFASRTLERGGSFAVVVPTVGSYELSYLLDGCRLYHSPTGLTGNAAEAMRFDAGDRDVRIGHRQVPDTMCAYQISGTIVGADGAPPGETYVWASSAGDWTDGDGSFTITVPVDGTYHVSFDLDGCTVHFGQGRLTGNRADARLIRVAGRNVSLSQRQVPVNVCAYQIGGRLVGSDGAPLGGVYISICQLVGDDCATRSGRNTDDDGAFAITVPTDGRYRLSLNFDGCSIYFRNGRFTATWQERSAVRVQGDDVQLGPLTIPAELCARQITARFVDADGSPLANKWMNVFYSGTSTSGAWTDDSGWFTVRVPSDGAYTFGIQLQSQPYCWHQLDGEALGSPNNPVRVSGGDMTGIVLRLPGTVDELCE